MSRIYLTGYRGTGKSTVGPLLAATLGWHFIDADAELERAAGRTIREIFAVEGELAFRNLEEATLAAVSREDRCVIATGGGVILREKNRETLKATGFVVWLTASAETIWERIRHDRTTAERRPALAQGGIDEVRELLAQREPYYRETANLTLETETRSPEALAAAILAAWEASSSYSS